MALVETRPVVCYRCGAVIGTIDTELTQTGMARFREQAAALRSSHRCETHETRKEAESAGSR